MHARINTKNKYYIILTKITVYYKTIVININSSDHIVNFKINALLIFIFTNNSVQLWKLSINLTIHFQFD